MSPPHPHPSLTPALQIRDSYLMALSGLLHHSGERVSPAVLATLGDTLSEMLRAAAAAPEGEEGDGFRWACTALGNAAGWDHATFTA